MSLPAKTEKRRQSNLEEVLEFCALLGRSMILNGANVERVQLATERICHSYGIEDLSLYILSTYISIAGRDGEGRYAQRQVNIPPAGINLNRLKRLNRLSYTITSARPAPERLKKMLSEAEKISDYPDWAILLAQMGGMVSLCFIFGGTWREIPPVIIVTALIHYLLLGFEKLSIDRIVANCIVMFIGAVCALALTMTGLGSSVPVIIITVSMLVIPGIPLVNSVRNLLCGNEQNGILQLFKVTIETLALGMGIYIAVAIFVKEGGADSAVVETLQDPWLLILLSFTASVSFGVVFRIPAKDLVWAGLGGVITRIVLILVGLSGANRLVLITSGALAASLYAEFMATVRKDPSTYFVYPSIVPLIPGDLFYYSLIGIYVTDRAMFEWYGVNCLLTLLGMSIGFVLSFTIAHYVRKFRHKRFVIKSFVKEDENESV
ncbi:MAG: threonine/serine exporter family protein [Oscillospiraceae bacterium]|nr:threonine/serine exporter family protein [Oscillospiraceae bacterium]